MESPSADFAKWMIRHTDGWFAWVRRLGLGVDRMENIILVTGAHFIISCTDVSFPTLAAKTVRRCHLGQRWVTAVIPSPSTGRSHTSEIEGVVLNHGPEGKV